MAEDNGEMQGEAEAVPAADVQADGDAGKANEGKSLAEGGGTPDDASRAPAVFPADWRLQASGGDEKAAKMLDRFNSPADLVKSYRSLTDKLRSGALKEPLAKDADEKAVAAWRKENGIPDDPAGYLSALPEGLVLGDDVKGRALDFATAMHAKNVAPDVVAEAIAWNQKAVEAEAAARAEDDKSFLAEAQDALRGEWGAEFRGNLNAINNMIASTAPQMEGDAKFFDVLMGGRTGDGKRIGDHPAVLRWLAGIANELNPAARIVPAGGGDAMESVQSGIAEIEKVMNTNMAKYRADPTMRARYQELLAAREKIKSRAA